MRERRSMPRRLLYVRDRDHLLRRNQRGQPERRAAGGALQKPRPWTPRASSRHPQGPPAGSPRSFPHACAAWTSMRAWRTWPAGLPPLACRALLPGGAPFSGDVRTKCSIRRRPMPSALRSVRCGAVARSLRLARQRPLQRVRRLLVARAGILGALFRPPAPHAPPTPPAPSHHPPAL